MSFSMNIPPVPGSASHAGAASYSKGHEVSHDQSTEKKEKARIYRQMLISTGQVRRVENVDSSEKGRMA